jgi:hypothetical protein
VIDNRRVQGTGCCSGGKKTIQSVHADQATATKSRRCFEAMWIVRKIATCKASTGSVMNSTATPGLLS